MGHQTVAQSPAAAHQTAAYFDDSEAVLQPSQPAC